MTKKKVKCSECGKDEVINAFGMCSSCIDIALKHGEIDIKESILKEADRLINGDRQTQYSHPTDDYKKTVGAFNAITGHKLTVKEGMLFMVCVKLSREAFKHKRDNLVDACGYLGCIEKHEDRLKEAI